VIPTLDVDERRMRERHRFAGLVRPCGGVIERVVSLRQEHTVPAFSVGTSSLGNLTMAFPHVAGSDGRDARNDSLGGAGADADPEKAWIRAVVEGAERYCCMVYDEADLVRASADELGDSALDLDRIPQCSAREYRDPACPLVRPNREAPIRWVRGYSLVRQRECFVPAVMTFLYLGPEPAERFWQPISTGVAAHTELAAALVAAICEGIERDAIALTWLARLRLARIEIPADIPEELETNWRLLQRSLVRQYCFDATTDLGIPTVYALQLVDDHPKLAQYVSCATDFSAAAALAKTIREAAPARAVFQMDREVPAEIADFRSLYDGAVYMGRPEQRRAFSFLLDSDTRRKLDDMAIDAPSDARGRLKFLLQRLRSLEMEAVAVDLTTDEVRESGLWVVRVIIPDVMPLSTTHRARFLGHPRLYEYAKKAGIKSFTEEQVNPAPQPFA
jgi:ribosomal protein S12 methylthiotransferase accessory factor